MKKEIKMKKQITIFAVLMAAVLCAGFLFPGAAAEDPGVKHGLAPVNPDFLKYVKNIEKGVEPSLSPGGYRLGYIPSPVDLSHVKGVIDDRVNETYPAYFDLREQGKVTRVKDQGRYYTCWIFSAFASLESCLLPEAVDFSEWHLAANHGFDYEAGGGGTSRMTTAYLIRWAGPVDEWLVSYPSSSNSASNLNTVRNGYPLAKHVQQVIFLPQRNDPLDNNTVEYFLTHYGPVDFSMYWDFDNFNQSYNSQYTPNNRGANHRLAIVGWDDNYPAANFYHTPPGNGVFIARNSWGEDWGESGYCYISYYDLSLQDFTSFNNAEPVNNYESIYQHDPLGRTSAWGAEDSWGANVFTAIDDRSLAAVGFYTNDANVQYDIYIYKNVIHTSGNDPRSGFQAAAKTGTFTYPGFYTVKLDAPVPLERGEKFSVVIRFVNPHYRHAVPLEIPIFHHSFAAVANPGESYVSRDGTAWDDLTEVVADANVCIKAYTEFPQARIDLRTERKVLSAWIIRRYYGEISFSIENLVDVPVSNIILSRKINGGEYEELLQLSPAELSGGLYAYTDEPLDQYSRYTYQVVTYNANGIISGKSNEETI